MTHTPSDEWLEAITPDVYQAFKRALELRRWPNGARLSPAQEQTCLQAIITYEHHHLPPEARTGYVPPKPTACGDLTEAEQNEEPVHWRD